MAGRMPKEIAYKQYRRIESLLKDFRAYIVNPPEKGKKTGRDSLGAIQFLEVYYSQNDEQVSDEMVDELEAFAKRTDSRSLAVGALNVLVETNCISDLGALSRIDDWKDAHYYGRM